MRLARVRADHVGEAWQDRGVTDSGIDPQRVLSIKAREDREFVAARPRSRELWAQGQAVMPNGVPMSWLRSSYDHPPLFVADAHGSRFRDADGFEYADFNIADMSMFTGYGPAPVVAAVSRRVANGSQFLLPSEDSVWVAGELGRRYGLPKWQFTLSATAANTEAIRVARAATGRERVVMFDGHYHGHFDESLVELVDGKLAPEEAGLPRDVTERTAIVSFNDPQALERALSARDVALVLTEPAMTNNVGLLMPDNGFHDRLRALTCEAGTLLAYDETHTQVVGAGGLTRLWGLRPDFVTIGKSIAAGIPLGAYGMTEEVADVLERPGGRDDPKPTVATGGTLFGNPLSMAAARAAMGEVLTDSAYAHTQQLGARLADGLDAVVEKAGLPWSVHRFWPRSGYTFAPTLPRNAAEASASLDVELRRLMRVYLANRGVWEAIVGAGPTCSVAANDADVDLYLGAFSELVSELTS
jgi:glutamate-1-semialdehyde 2,1-aminomutase